MPISMRDRGESVFIDCVHLKAKCGVYLEQAMADAIMISVEQRVAVDLNFFSDHYKFDHNDLFNFVTVKKREVTK